MSNGHFSNYLTLNMSHMRMGDIDLVVETIEASPFGADITFPGMMLSKTNQGYGFDLGSIPCSTEAALDESGEVTSKRFELGAEMKKAGFSAEFVTLVFHAVDNGCEVIRFESDVKALDNYPIFDLTTDDTMEQFRKDIGTKPAGRFSQVTLSDKHIRAQDWTILEAYKTDRYGSVGEDGDTGAIVGKNTDGYQLAVQPLSVHSQKALRDQGFSEEFLKLAEYAHNGSCNRLILSSAAIPVAGFPVFNRATDEEITVEVLRSYGR